MALTDADRTNFDNLRDALKKDRVALIQSSLQEDGEYRALICAMNFVDGEYRPVPFAVMVWDDPYTLFNDPTEEADAPAN